ncbi:MAG: hypothetical protein ACN6P1_19995 [Pseudomonas sp.]|uniref:hypothetical protein n=1 Tax=Pseudomonas sp. TaxID=306 RepID=UPI003D1373C0
MILNNREIAILFWLAIALLFAFRKGINKDVTKSFTALIKSFFHIKIQTIIWGGIAWASLCVVLLEEAGIWTLSNLKTTLVWGCTFAFISTMNAYKVAETKDYFREELRGLINATAVITFITEAYSFSILTEVIITPIITLLVIIQVLSEREPRYATLQKISTFMLAFAGLAYIANALYMLANNFSDFATLENLREFLTPALLTCFYLLYIYVVSIYMAYENLSVGLTYAITEPGLRRYAVFKAAWAFKTNHKALNRWKTNVGTSRPQCKNEVIASIKEVTYQIYREKNPIPITPEQGWQPTKAASFLTEKNLTVEDYHRTDGGEWWGDAHILKIESDRFNWDSITYVIRGTDIAVRRLKLEVTVNNKDLHALPERLFIEIGTELILHSTGHCEADLKQAINTDSNIDIITGTRRVRLSRENYTYTKTGGYLRTLIIDYQPNYLGPEDEG